MPKIVFRDKNVTIDVARGTSVLDAALDRGLSMYHTCGGNASCSTCRIRVLQGGELLSPIEDAESQVLDSFDLKPPHRLGCQAQVLGDVEIEIPGREKAPRPNKTPKLPE
jgi:2Fe-2S ferredoxin